MDLLCRFNKITYMMFYIEVMIDETILRGETEWFEMDWLGQKIDRKPLNFIPSVRSIPMFPRSSVLCRTYGIHCSGSTGTENWRPTNEWKTSPQPKWGKWTALVPFDRIQWLSGDSWIWPATSNFAFLLCCTFHRKSNPTKILPYFCVGRLRGCFIIIHNSKLNSPLN